MAADKRAVLREWLSSGNAALHPLTFPQRELWETSPVPAGDPANHICCVIPIRGPMKVRTCEKALQCVIDRQDVMCLSFLPGKEQPLQLIRRTGEQALQFRELKSSEHSDEALEEVAAEFFLTPFDMLQGPLHRALLVQRSPEDFVLVFAIHHAISDGWTLGLFIEELSLGYMAEKLGLRDAPPPVPQTYAAWGAAERAYWQPAELAKRAAFWQPELAGAPRLWNALEGPATASGAHHRQLVNLPNKLVAATQETARVAGATLYSTLLSAFQVAISRWTGQDDVLVGTPFANRSTSAVRETMGYCASIVPLRFQVDPAARFSDSLRAVHQKTVDGSANAMPFVELARALGDAGRPGHNPVFEVRFALQNHPMPDASIQGISGQLKMRSTGTARFHIACEISVLPECLEIAWLYRPSLFPHEEIARLSRMFVAILESVCRAPDERILQVGA